MCLPTRVTELAIGLVSRRKIVRRNLVSRNQDDPAIVPRNDG